MKPSTLVPGAILALNSLTWPVAAGTLDQEYLPSQASGLIIERSQTLAQTFEVGLTGTLDRIEVELARNTIAAPEGLTLEIRSTLADGSPSANVLAGIFIPGTDVPTEFQFMSFDLVPFGITVTGGDALALVLRSDAEPQGQVGGIDPFGWRGDAPGNYSRGTVYVDRGSGFGLASGWDFGFRTFVDTTAVPEPAGLPTLFCAAGVLLVRSRGRFLNSLR